MEINARVLLAIWLAYHSHTPESHSALKSDGSLKYAVHDGAAKWPTPHSILSQFTFCVALPTAAAAASMNVIQTRTPFVMQHNPRRVQASCGTREDSRVYFIEIS